MQFKIFCTSVLFLLFFQGKSLAQVKFVNEFLNIGVGARAHAMSGSVVASVSDGTAGYWNTAALTELEVPFQINAMHAEWFGGISNYDYFSIAKRLNKEKSSYASLSFIRLGVDDIPNTLNLIGADGSVNYDKITNFSASDYAFFISYATKVDDANKFSIGGNVKIIRRVIGPFAGAWGFGADLSVSYKLNDNITLAASGRDITTTFNAWSFNLDEASKEVFTATNNQIPSSSVESTIPRFILGSAYKNTFRKFTYLAEIDINLSTDGRQSGLISSDNFALDPSLGIEIGYDDLVFIRGGIGNIQKALDQVNPELTRTEFQPNIGLGIQLGRVTVDYALANVGNVSGILASHIFSLKLSFLDRNEKQ